MIVLLTIVGAILTITILALVVLIITRARAPHSKRMGQEKERVIAKAKACGMTPPTSVPVEKDAEEGQGAVWRTRVTKLIGRNIVTILLICAGAAIAGFGLYGSAWKTPTLKELGTWAEAHWFWVLVGWGVLAGIIAVNAKPLGKAAGVLQNTLAWITIALLVAAVATAVITSLSGGSHTTAQAAVPLGDYQPITMSPGGKTELVLIPLGATTDIIGTNAHVHVVYTDERTEVSVPIDANLPGGPIKGFYVTNDLEKTANTVYYRFK